MTKYLRIGEVAAITGVPVNTLRYWRNQGEGVGPPSGRLGRRVVYRLDELEDWIEAQFERTSPK